MIQGSNTYIEIRPRVDMELVAEMIFSFFAGATKKLILQKRYPEDVAEINGKLYLGFTQEDTMQLYKLSGNGEVELETQANLVNKAVIQQPKRGIKVRRTRAVELVPGNAPHYEMPDTVIDIVTGDVILLKGDPGKPGDSITVASVTESAESGGENIVTFSDGKVLKVKNGEDAPDGMFAPLVHTHDVSKMECPPFGAFATLPASSWSDDTSLSDTKLMRVVYVDENNKISVILDSNVKAQGPTQLTDAWKTFSSEFTYNGNARQALRLIFLGGPDVAYVQPYDIADVRVYLASDSTKTNILKDDIADLNWQWYYKDSENDRLNRFAVAYEDGLKYIHVWKLSRYKSDAGHNVKGNLVRLMADTGTNLTIGEKYVLECRMRTTCKRSTCIVPCDGIRAHSATVVAPVHASAELYGRFGVRAFAERTGELMFVCDTKPTSDLTASVVLANGRGGAIINTLTEGYVSGGGVSGTYSGGVGGYMTVMVSSDHMSSTVVYYSPGIIDVGGTFGTLDVVDNGKLYRLTAGQSIYAYFRIIVDDGSEKWSGAVPIMTFTGSAIELFYEIVLESSPSSSTFFSCYYYPGEPDVHSSPSSLSAAASWLNEGGVTYEWNAY